MKKLVFSILLICVWGLVFAQTQLADYHFEYSQGIYEELTDGISLGNESSDEHRFLNPEVPLGTTSSTVFTGTGYPIGFEFYFSGHVFDRVGISTNGWLSLGQSSGGSQSVEMTSTNLKNTPLSTIASSSYYTDNPQLVSRIAGFGRDLQAQAGASIMIQTIGEAPNRTFVAQWKNYRRKSASGESFNFQIRMNEANSQVVITYGQMTASTTFTPQVGLRAAPHDSPANFATRVTLTDWTESASGTLAGDTMTMSTMVYPAAGTQYIWKPMIDHTVHRFGNQNYLSSSASHVFTLKNYGDTPITINSISEIQGHSEDFLLETNIIPGYSLAPGATANFAITFNPQNLYWRSGSLDISTSLFDVTINFSGLAIRNMQLIYPNGGETLASGNTFKVQWARSGHPKTIIKFSPDNGANWLTPFLTPTPIDNQLCSYYFTVPNVNSTQCIVRMEWDEDGSHFDQSDAPFTVSNTSDQSVISVTQPNTGDMCLLRGNTYQIKWTTTNTPLISIDLSIDDGTTWSPIAERVNSLNLPATTNTYDWIVPNIMTTTARIRIRNWANSAHYDITDYSFIIGALEVNSFNDGGVFYNDWSESYEHGIYFTAINISAINVKYSLNGGGSWLSCAGVLSSSNYPFDSGVYYWKLPGNESNSCLVRIEKSGDASVYAVGNQIFELRNKVRFRNFYGGEYINPNTTVTARWRLMSIDPQTPVTLQYSYGSSYPSIWFNANPQPIPVGDLKIDNLFMNTTGQSYAWYRLVESSSDKVLTRSTTRITITTKRIDLVNPNGEDTLFAGETETIQWNQDGCTSFDIFLTTNDGDTWTKLNTTTVSATENSFLWTVPSLVSHECSIKIQHTGSSLFYMVKQSEQKFTITIPPVIEFSSDVAGGLVPVEVQFTDLSQPGIGTIVDWHWAFGDSGVSSEQNPLHTYANPGVYSVSLQVTNSVGAYYTLEKEHYINVLAVGALISYTPPSVSFMDLPYGQLTDPINVTITNSGNAPLSLSSSHFKLQGTHFSVANLNTPILIGPGASHSIAIRFMPSSFDTVSDSLVIINNSVNLPQGGLKLTGRAASQEPMPPQSVDITVQDQDVLLTWEPVTQTISGVPITTAYYAVFYNGSVDEQGGSFYYHGWTTDTSYIHSRVVQFSPNMFYRVRAITEYRGEKLLEILESAGRQTSETELLEQLRLSRKASK